MRKYLLPAMLLGGGVLTALAAEATLTPHLEAQPLKSNQNQKPCRVIDGTASRETVSAYTASECWNRDTCTTTMDCVPISGVWTRFMPANYLQWKAGPKVPFNCVRIIYPGPPCVTGGVNDTIPRDSCGVYQQAPPN